MPGPFLVERRRKQEAVDSEPEVRAPKSFIFFISSSLSGKISS